MRKPIKKGKKLDPKWDGPFVVVGLTDKDAYQLAGPNGYVLENLVNGQRLRKLNLDEIDEYKGQFWNASQRLKKRDQDAKDKREQRDLDRKIKEATMEVLDAQRKGQPASLQKHHELSQERRRLQEMQAQQNPLAPASTSTKPAYAPARPAPATPAVSTRPAPQPSPIQIPALSTAPPRPPPTISAKTNPTSTPSALTPSTMTPSTQVDRQSDRSTPNPPQRTSSAPLDHVVPHRRSQRIRKPSTRFE